MGIFKKKTDGIGLDCSPGGEDEGSEYCKVMTRHRNKKLSTGSEVEFGMDDNCRPIIKRWSVFEDDEPIVQRKLKQAEAECRRNKGG